MDRIEQDDPLARQSEQFEHMTEGPAMIACHSRKQAGMHAEIQITACGLPLPEEVDHMQDAAQAIEFHQLVVAGGLIEQSPYRQLRIGIGMTARKPFVPEHDTRCQFANRLKAAGQGAVEITALRPPLRIGAQTCTGLRVAPRIRPV